VPCFTEVITEFRVSWRSDQGPGEACNGRSNGPRDMAMEMATEETSIGAETAGTTIFEPMERNEHRKRRRWGEAPAAPSDWSSCMESTI